jgi:hypothetical protein
MFTFRNQPSTLNKGDSQMRYRKQMWFLTLAAFVVTLAVTHSALGQQPEAFSKEEVEYAKRTPMEAAAAAPLPRCRGAVLGVADVGDERVRFTSAIYGTTPGGGEGRQFDRTPVLTIPQIQLAAGRCLDAHLSAIIGSRQTYGVSRMALFQVTLTRIAPGPVLGPRHMVGHYETPFGRPSPAVALEAERDVDMYASNFFQRVGNGPHEVPPGLYRVDVWWAGGPDPGGAIGAAFVLKLYFR